MLFESSLKHLCPLPISIFNQCLELACMAANSSFWNSPFSYGVIYSSLSLPVLMIYFDLLMNTPFISNLISLSLVSIILPILAKCWSFAGCFGSSCTMSSLTLVILPAMSILPWILLWFYRDRNTVDVTLYLALFAYSKVVFTTWVASHMLSSGESLNSWVFLTNQHDPNPESLVSKKYTDIKKFWS